MGGRRIVMSDAFSRYSGELSKGEYVRRLVSGAYRVMAVCKKPRYTKAQRRKMAERPQILRFKAVNAEAKAIWDNPEEKSKWALRHESAKRAAMKNNEHVSVRLWDFIRHELNQAKIMAEKGSKI